MKKPIFTGTCTALVTPFGETGAVDYKVFARQISRQIDAGADAICVCGTTGECAALEEAEQEEVIAFCIRHAARRVKVIAGTGSSRTAHAVARSKRAQEAGADAVLVVTPYYNKATQTGLVRHYEAIADAINIPMILYNVPGRTGVSISAETYAHLSKHPNINGAKEASGDFSLLSQVRSRCGEGFYIWSGNDDQVVPAMSMGAKGVISAVSNLIPREMTELTHLCLEGNYRKACEIQLYYAELIANLFSEVNPIPVKAAMNLSGLAAGLPRLPLCEMSQKNLELLRDSMKKAGLLPRKGEA